MDKLYTDDSIQSLSPREFTRLRPGVYCGSTDYSTQLLIEIVSNAIDEWTVGHGDLIKVNINDDGSCSVEDFAQGFPVNSIREDGETVLQASFDVLNTSGKFTEDGVYSGTALGLNGIGGKLVNFLTLWTEVTTYRDGQSEFIRFEDGIFKTRKIGKQDRHHTGTTVKWKPDPQFFTNPQIETDRVKKLFNVLSCLCPGLKIELTLNDSEEIITYYSENGLHKLMDEIVLDKEIIKNRLSINETIDEKNKIDFILSYADTYSLNMNAYVNTGATDNGPHITQIKTIITREFNKFFKDKNWLKDKDANLSGDDLQEGMVIMFNITAPGISYDAQTKSRIVKIDMTPFSPTLVDNIQFWLNKNEKEIKLIFDKAISARKAREAAKKAREAIRKNDNKKKTNLNLPTKLVDAWSKDRNGCELLIAEGDSAVAGLIGARDSETQACFPVRGKVINCFKNKDEKVFANQEVVNIIKAIGLDLDEKTKMLKYDKDRLRYGKIILCCDADSDGMAIKNLLLTCFWSLCPDLLINGHLYVATPPLFRITTSKNQYVYLKNIEELESYKEQHKNEKFLINRNKGLGEQDSSELEECLLNPNTRNVVQVIVDDVKKADKLFNTLMGELVVPRREYILKYSETATEVNY